MANQNLTAGIGGLLQGLGQGLAMRRNSKLREEERKLREQQAKAQLRLTELKANEAERRQLSERTIAARVQGVAEPPAGLGGGPGIQPTTLSELVKSQPGLFLGAGATPAQLLSAEQKAGAPERNAAFLRMIGAGGGGTPQLGPQPSVTPAAAPGGPPPVPAAGAAPAGPGAAPQPVSAQPVVSPIAQAGQVSNQPPSQFVLTQVRMTPTGEPQAQFEANKPVGRPFPMRTPDGGFINVQRWLNGSLTSQALPPDVRPVDLKRPDGSTVRIFPDVAPRGQLPGATPIGDGGLRPAGAQPVTAAPRARGPAGGIQIAPPSGAVQAEEFVPEGELKNIRLIDRTSQTLRPAPFNIRRSDLNEENFVRVSTGQADRLDTLQGAIAVLGELQRTAGKVFTAEAGFLERAVQGGRQFYENLLQSDPDLVEYRQASQAFLSTMARAAASEKGPISDRDIPRVGKALPRLVNIGGLPDTAEVAQRKMALLDRLLKGNYNKIVGRQVFDIVPVSDAEIASVAETTPADDLLRQSESLMGDLERGFVEKSGELLKKMVDPLNRLYNNEDL